MKEEYNDSDIQVLEGLEAVRKSPGMYIGTTSERGLHHLVWEIVDNAVDEALAGYCHDIEVSIEKNNVISVKDNGRGMPTGINAKTGLSTIETIFTVLHAGGKFGGGGYKVSGGLHGVGASVVNALSSWLEVRVYRDGHVYFQRFENGGHPIDELKIIDECDKDRTGTTVTFKADPTVFKETTVYNYETLATRLEELAFLNKGLRIILTDLREDEKKDETAPTMEIGNLSETTTQIGKEISFDITYKDETEMGDITLNNNDITLYGFKADVKISGEGNTRKVTLSNIQGNLGGLKYIRIASKTAKDKAGNEVKESGKTSMFKVVNNDTKNKPDDWIENPNTGR